MDVAAIIRRFTEPETFRYQLDAPPTTDWLGTSGPVRWWSGMGNGGQPAE